MERYERRMVAERTAISFLRQIDSALIKNKDMTKEQIVEKYGECEMTPASGGPWISGGKGQGIWVYEVSNIPEDNIRFQGFMSKIYAEEHIGRIKIKDFEDRFDLFRLVKVRGRDAGSFSFETLFEHRNNPYEILPRDVFVLGVVGVLLLVSIS